MSELWGEIEQFQDSTPTEFKGKPGLAILPSDVSAAESPGTSGVAAADHVHRGVGSLEVAGTYLRGEIEIIAGDDIDVTASTTDNSITIDLEDDITVDSVNTSEIAAANMDITGILRVNEIRPETDSPAEEILLNGDVSVTGILRIDEIRPESNSPTGDILLNGDVTIPTTYGLALADLSGDIITTTDVETSIEELDASQYAEANTGFGAWTSGSAAATYTVDGTGFQIDRSGSGWIRGKAVTWAAGIKTSALAANTTSWIYVNSAGEIGSTTTWSETLFQDYIVLFECLFDGTNYVTVRENHPANFQAHISTEWHELIGVLLKGNAAGPIGANIGRVATGTGAATGDREIKITGAAELCDHGLDTTIPDSAGVGVTFNWYYTNASGKWIRQSSQTQAPMFYNNAGALAAIGSGKYGVFRLYVSKDDIEASTPKYFAVLHTAQYTNAPAARAVITSGTASTTNELYSLELAQLGYIIVLNNASGGYIFEVDVEKSVLAGGTTGAGASNLAALVSVSTALYDGAPTEILSSADSNVQNALNTINDFLKTAHTASGNWSFTDDLYVGDGLYVSGTVYTDIIEPDSQSPTGDLSIIANTNITGALTVSSNVSIDGNLFVDTIYPYSASPAVDIRIDHNLDVSGTLRVDGNLYAPNVSDTTIEYDPNRVVQIATEWLTAAIAGEPDTWVATLSGTGAAIALDTTHEDEDHIGIVKIETGTTTGGYSYLTYRSYKIAELVADTTIEVDWIIRTDAVSDNTNNYSLYVGFIGPSVNSAFIGFRYNHALNSGNWTAKTEDSNETETNTGTAFAANTWYHFKIIATTTSASFYINDVLEATHTTYIPDGVDLAPMAFIIKSAGTTSRSVWGDACTFRKEWSAGRV